MKVIVYVDGFNLYYGCLKGTPYKWLDLSKLSQFLFPNAEINQIKYFTALVKIRTNDPDHDKPNRQQIYLRALRTLPNIEIILGAFLSHGVMMKKADNSGYVSPFEKNTIELKKIATFVKQIRKGVLSASQFPEALADEVGDFTKPENW